MKCTDTDEFEALKKVFERSSEYVFFLDYDFNILWCNSEEFLPSLEKLCAADMFRGIALPLKSGEYSFSLGGMAFSCRVINYDECEMYVMQSPKDETFFSFVKNSAVQKFLMNQSGAVRQAVFGIINSGKAIEKALSAAGVENDTSFLDVIYGNCCRLLRNNMNTVELIRYTDSFEENRIIDLSDLLEEFTGICNGILGEDLRIELETEKGLMIESDSEKLTTCLLSMIVYAKRRSPKNDVIYISAEKSGGFISVTASTQKSGKINYETAPRHSSYDRLYDEDEVDTDLIIIHRFCRAFGGTLFTAEGAEGRMCSIRLPELSCPDSPIFFETAAIPYSDNSFTKYHAALSEIADIPFV